MGSERECSGVKQKGFFSRARAWLPDDLTPLIYGSALFSMFFGAGNVVYSLWLGYATAQPYFFSSLIGFCITGILLPFLVLLSMACSGEKPIDFFRWIPCQRVARVLLTFLLLVWAPLGSIPRAIELAYTSIAYIWPHRPWAWTHLAIALLMGALASSPARITNLLGKWLTPALLALITTLSFLSLTDPHFDQISKAQMNEPSIFFDGRYLSEGALLGYQTMDGIAAIFFAAFFISMTRNEKKSHAGRNTTKDLVWTFLFAIMIELTVYSSLMLSASTVQMKLLMESPAQLLHQIAEYYMGSYGSIVSSWIILLAVIPTAVTLVSITMEYFSEQIVLSSRGQLDKQQIHLWNVFLKVTILFVGFLMSLLRIEGLKNFTQPLLEMAYPLILVLGAANIARSVWKRLYPEGIR